MEIHKNQNTPLKYKFAPRDDDTRVGQPTPKHQPKP